MLDLVVEPAQRRVDQPAAADVARGQHLLAQEVLGAVRVRHALVVGREGHAEVDPEQRLVHDEERERLQRVTARAAAQRRRRRRATASRRALEPRRLTCRPLSSALTLASLRSMPSRVSSGKNKPRLVAGEEALGPRRRTPLAAQISTLGRRRPGRGRRGWGCCGAGCACPSTSRSSCRSPRLPATSPARSLGRLVRNTCRWARSWATSATWANTIARKAATASVHHEEPTRKKAVQPPTSTPRPPGPAARRSSRAAAAAARPG